MFKYYFYILLSAFLVDCGSGGRRITYPPSFHPSPRPHTNTTQAGNCYYALMTVEDAGQYEHFLAETPVLPFCGKTGGRWFVNKQIFGGQSACKNWIASPTIELSFDLQFTRIQKLQINPRGSGSGFVGNQGTSGYPVLFQTNAVITPQNRNKGWTARIPPANTLSQGYIELYCRHCDFEKNADMSIQLKYRERHIGSFDINPKNTISRCPSSSSVASPYPHAY